MSAGARCCADGRGPHAQPTVFTKDSGHAFTQRRVWETQPVDERMPPTDRSLVVQEPLTAYLVMVH